MRVEESCELFIYFAGCTITSTPDRGSTSGLTAWSEENYYQAHGRLSKVVLYTYTDSEVRG